MAITTINQLIAGASQRVLISKTASRTSVAVVPFGVLDLAGNPGAGTLAGTSTTAGVVPTDATAGFPLIAAFGGGNTGYIKRVDGNSTVAGRLQLYDMLWKAGAYAFNASTSGNTPATYSDRLPATDYTGLEIWYEQVTVSTGIQSVVVTYTNHDGTTGRTTGTISQGTAGIVGRMMQLPLQAGDKGLQGITGVVGSVSTAGTFNLYVLRPLDETRIRVVNDGVIKDFAMTGLPVIYETSALFMIVTPDGTSTGLAEMAIDIANG